MSKEIATRLPLFIVFLMIVSAAAALPDKIVGRNLFYLATFFSLLFAAFNYKKICIKRENALLATGFLLVGLSQFFWVQRFPAEADSLFMADANYPRTSVYLMVGALVVLLLSSLSQMVQFSKRGRVTIALLALVGFAYLSSRGLYYSFTHPGLRMRIDSAATLSAYLYALQALITLYLVHAMNCPGKRVINVLVVSLAALVILLTQTRSVLIIFPLLILAFVLFNRFWSFRLVLTSCLAIGAVMALIIGLLFHNVFDRINQAYTELTEYSSHNNTSVGARLSMWKSGLYAAGLHPGGQSAAVRFQEVKNYMDKYEQGNREGKRNAVYHLHNDIIDGASLQGVAGGVALLLLFAALFHFFYKKGILPSVLPLLIAPVIIFGSVDTLFINDRFIIIFSLQVALLAFITNRQSVAADSIKTR